MQLLQLRGSVGRRKGGAAKGGRRAAKWVLGAVKMANNNNNNDNNSNNNNTSHKTGLGLGLPFGAVRGEAPLLRCPAGCSSETRQPKTRRDETQRVGAGADDQPIAQVNYDCKSTSQVSQDNNKLHTLSVSPSPSVTLSLSLSHRNVKKESKSPAEQQSTAQRCQQRRQQRQRQRQRQHPPFRLVAVLFSFALYLQTAERFVDRTNSDPLTSARYVHPSDVLLP